MEWRGYGWGTASPIPIRHGLELPFIEYGDLHSVLRTDGLAVTAQDTALGGDDPCGFFLRNNDSPDAIADAQSAKRASLGVDSNVLHAHRSFTLELE